MQAQIRLHRLGVSVARPDGAGGQVRCGRLTDATRLRRLGALGRPRRGPCQADRGAGRSRSKPSHRSGRRREGCQPCHSIASMPIWIRKAMGARRVRPNGVMPHPRTYRSARPYERLAERKDPSGGSLLRPCDRRSRNNPDRFLYPCQRARGARMLPAWCRCP